jgi:hypothetical protein
MNLFKTSIIAAFGIAMTLGTMTGASAETYWERHHPRRDEVMDRLHNQNLRIRDERREGEINGYQARGLHAEDRAIFRREQREARVNGGYITKGEQHHINRELNGVSGQIGR